MAPEILHRVLFSHPHPPATQTRSLTIHPAVLPGYTRHRVVGCDYPAILPDSSSSTSLEACVRGTYVTGLTDGQIGRLDAFEGGEYVRERLKVTCLDEGGKEEGGVDGREGEREVEAETYVWGDRKRGFGRNGLEEGEWDFEEFRREKMGRWVGREGRGEYAEVDEAVERKKLRDPTGGRGMDGEIGRKLNGVGESERAAPESAV